MWRKISGFSSLIHLFVVGPEVRQGGLRPLPPSVLPGTGASCLCEMTVSMYIHECLIEMLNLCIHMDAYIYTYGCVYIYDIYDVYMSSVCPRSVTHRMFFKKSCVQPFAATFASGSIGRAAQDHRERLLSQVNAGGCYKSYGGCPGDPSTHKVSVR